jgi:3',5'-cyclic AMP phosphodiesterase CpdA
LIAALLVALLALFAAGCGEEAEEPAASSADTVIDADRLTVAATGDIGMERSGVATLEAMGGANADLYLGLGDFSYAGPGSEPEFCDLVHSSVGAEAAFEVVSGNHEEDTGEDGRIAEFAKCLPDRAGAEGRYGTEYYFDVGDLARFIMISPDLTIEGEHYYYGAEDDGGDTPNLAWLEQAIDEAHDEGRWVVVGMHKNCISVGEYYCDVYQDLFSALIEHDVDLVLSGHDHSFQRSKQISTGPGCPEVVVDEFDPDCVADSTRTYRAGAGTVFVVAAAGGAELYDVHPDDPEAKYFAATMGRNTRGSRSGFALLDITPERMSVRFVGSTPGSFEDAFEIERGASN